MKRLRNISVINLTAIWKSSFRKLTVAFSIILLGSSGIMPLVFSNSASAAQLTSRKITLGSSEASAADVTYTLAYTIATTGNIGGVVIDFCSNSPITGTSCTAPTGFDTNKDSLALGTQTGITDFAVDTTNSDANTIILTRTAASVSSGTAVTTPLGSSGGSDGLTNPSTDCDANTTADECSYYARVLTYATTAAAQGYTSTSPGAFVDNGGIAISTANQLTITARVQEVLQFCVGDTDSGANDDCRDISGNDIDLEVVDSSTVNVNDGVSVTDGPAFFMIRTNASSGAQVDYFAEQETSSGKLKVVGAACGSATSETDQCFNNPGDTAAVEAAIVAGAEAFGMTCATVNTSNGSTTNLTRDAQYDNSVGYTWQDSGATDTVATSSTVLDDEMCELEFAATAAPTTPTGAYTVTATFIATATF